MTLSDAASIVYAKLPERVEAPVWGLRLMPEVERLRSMSAEDLEAEMATREIERMNP